MIKKFPPYEQAVLDAANGLPSYEEAVFEPIQVVAEADLYTHLPETIGAGYHSGVPYSKSIFDDISRL